MRLIQIHAGIHKTGSTAIQHTLARLAPGLADHGVALPVFGKRGQLHHALATLGSDPEGSARAWAKLARRIRKIGAERIVLSSEHFVSTDPAALRAALAGLGEAELRIHFYVRPHIALFTSLYLQRVKAGVATAGPLDLVESYTTAPEFDYVPAIARYIEVFGEDAVFVRAFEPERFEGGSLIADLWAFLDLPPALLPTAVENGDTIVNPTPTAEQAVLLLALAGRLRAAMGWRGDQQAMRRALWTLLSELRARLDGPATAYRLPIDLQHAIKDQTEPGRATLAPRLDRPASPAFLSEPVIAPQPIAPIPFATVSESLAATVAMLRGRNLIGWAAATERFAARLTSKPGADGTPVLRLPAPRFHQMEGVA